MRTVKEQSWAHTMVDSQKSRFTQDAVVLIKIKS